MRVQTILICVQLSFFATVTVLAKNARDASNFIGRFDDVKKDLRVVDAKPLRKFATESAKKCIQHCLQHGQCKSTNMNEELGQCELLSISLSHDPSVQTESKPGWLYQGFIKRNPMLHQQQNTITAEEKEKCYKEQSDPDNLLDEQYCIEPFFFDGKLHISCSPKCDTKRMLPFQSNEPPVCVSGMGSTEETSGGSCKEIKEKCRGVKSGKFWIQLTSGTNKLCYCDMETKGGGWLLIGNMNITDDSETTFTTDQLKTDFNGMENIADGENKLLQGSKMTSLMNEHNVKEIHIQCTKAWHKRTLHIVFTKESPVGQVIYNYLKGDVSSISGGFCPQPFIFLEDDNSNFSEKDCTQYRTLTDDYEIRLYGAWAWVGGYSHILLGWHGRNECDDYLGQQGFTHVGIWKYYIR